MVTWVNDLLNEWRQRSAEACTDDNAADRQTPALDMLKAHIKRGGVQLRLTEAPASRRRGDPARETAKIAPACEAPDEGTLRFGRRLRTPEAPETPRQLLRMARERIRTPNVVAGSIPDMEICAGPLPLKRWREQPLPADVRLAADTMRAAAYGEVEALRADLARLKQTLADVLLENHELKKQLDVRSHGSTLERNARDS